jgi:hypothetical protein
VFVASFWSSKAFLRLICLRYLQQRREWVLFLAILFLGFISAVIYIKKTSDSIVHHYNMQRPTEVEQRLLRPPQKELGALA